MIASSRLPRPPLRLDRLDEADAVTYRLRVPGYRRRDLTIEVRDRVMLVRGQRTFGWFRPRAKQSFFQAIRLPDALDERDVRANLAAGVLRLTIAKKPHARRRQIPVQAAGAASPTQAAPRPARRGVMEWIDRAAAKLWGGDAPSYSAGRGAPTSPGA